MVPLAETERCSIGLLSIIGGGGVLCVCKISNNFSERTGVVVVVVLVLLLVLFLFLFPSLLISSEVVNV
jgi:hypothetical protein